jgi:glycosyltransferase involved in cell wall biosynthesis
VRIALIVPGGVDRSGDYRVIPVLLALIARLARDHELHVFALNQELERASWQLHGAQIHNIGPGPRFKAAAAIVRQHHTTAFDLVHAIWSGACGLTAVTAGLLMRRPSLIHVAGGELVWLADIGFGGMGTRRSRWRERTVLKLASRVSAASAPTLARLAALGVHASRIPLGVDLNSWALREPVRRDLARPARLLHVASLNRVKDQQTLLKAASSLARAGVDFRLRIIGEDTLGGEMQAAAAALGLGAQVDFLGFRTQAQLHPEVAAADLLLHSSRHETGPVVMLEAAALGVPTVGTAVGHIAEWAPEAAVAVPVGDAEGLAQGVLALLGDEERRLRLGAAALQRAAREDADHTARAFQALYAEVA